MYIIIIILLITVCIIIGGLYLLLKREVANIKKQMDFIISNDTNKVINNISNDKDVLKLSEAINQIILKQREDVIATHQVEFKLKSTINNISHDLRTPLTVIKGYLQMIESSDMEATSKEVYIKEINLSLLQLSNKIDQLFEYAKIQEHESFSSKKKVVLNEIIQSQILLYYHQFEELAFDVDLSLPSEYKIHANIDALERILHNVFSNVLRYGDTWMKLSLEEEKEYLHLQISNHTAYDISNVDSLFERFYIEDMSRTSNSTGLGLAIVKDLIEKMDGKASIRYDQNIFELSLYFPKVK